jgi:hypothetical protein
MADFPLGLCQNLIPVKGRACFTLEHSLAFLYHVIYKRKNIVNKGQGSKERDCECCSQGKELGARERKKAMPLEKGLQKR